jgi:adenylate cyclase
VAAKTHSVRRDTTTISLVPALGAVACEPEPCALQALMVTDLVEFTALLVRLGDFRAQQVIQAHNRILRDCIRTHHGAEVTHTGDGMLDTFRSTRSSLECAKDLRARFAVYSASHPEAPLVARIGLHVGEPVPEDGRLFGACVNVTVRICSTAPACCIWVSEAMRLIAAGQDIQFADRGVFSLKGLSAPMRLYEAYPEAST